MPLKKLKEFLDSHNIKYQVISHSPAYTAQEVAANSHISGNDLAKTVIVKLDGIMSMAVLPASFKVDLDKLKEAAGAGTIELANEDEFSDSFPECEPGAMPPFGNLFGLKLYMAEILTENRVIAFNAGSFNELVKLSFKDYERLAKPVILKFASQR